MNPPKGPLHGVRIVDLSTVVAGPMATQMLADQGAEVIKVEAPPVGDLGRNPGSSRNGMSATFHNFNRGKRSILLDLKTPEGLAVLHRLIATADVLVHNFRPGVTARLGIDYDTLRGAHPELVYAGVNGFGEAGPLASRPAYDHIVQCYSGFAALQADAAGGGRPALIRNVVVDKLTALTAAQAITAALLARANGAGGQEIKLSMLGAAIAFLWPDAAVEAHLAGEGGEVRPSMAAFCRLYAFRNGYVTFNASDASFPGICKAFNAPTGADPRLRTSAGRIGNVALMAEVEREWAAAVAQIDVDEGIAILEALDAPCAKVVSLKELPDHPQVRANGYLRVVDHPVAGPLVEAAPAAQFSATPAAAGAPAPTLGQHTQEILAELGLG
jgi:crotonobetainyl-CoA:carnitine CoA-transferase CaiB-like acyl-CoA transferase